MMIIDRFEGDYAIIEYNRKTFNLPKVFISKGAKEGDVLEISVSVKKEATKELMKKNQQQIDDLFED